MLESDGGFNLRYDSAVSIAYSDDPQLLVVNVVRSNASPAPTAHSVVEIMPQPNLQSVEAHFVTSERQVVPSLALPIFEPGDILGVAYAPPSSPRPPTNIIQVSGVSNLPPAAAAAAASSLPALLECLISDQRTSLLRDWTGPSTS